MGASHGTRTRYNLGCEDGPNGTSCDPCRKANREYYKKRQLAKKAAEAEAATTGTVVKRLVIAPKGESEAPPAEPGPMELGCLAVIENLPAAQKRPDLVAGALALTRILDGGTMYAAQAKSVLNEYRATMDQLLKGSERKGKLAAVRQMTKKE